MCGIYGYIGKANAAEQILEGLKRLEYRGYDSWGIAVSDGKKISVLKHTGEIGKADDISELPSTNIGIGHTRWATHGGVTEINAHPHFATDKSFILAQNGIVENYQELKDSLIKKGYKFTSQTDTEVIVHLIESLNRGDLFIAVQKAFRELTGRNTIILLSKEGDRVIAVRNGSPLVIGVGKDEYFFASDTLSFAHKTNKVIFLKDNEIADFHNGRLQISNVLTDKKVRVSIKSLTHQSSKIDKGGFDHFMLKEIVEQKETISKVLSYTPKELQPLITAIKSAKHVFIVGAGTAGFAAGQIAYYLRTISKIPVIELKSYEYMSYASLFKKGDLIIAVSQSGETADTIEAVDYAKKKGLVVASLVNMLGSTITRISDLPYFTQAGPEICVASTKVFTSQVSFGLLLSYAVVNKYREGYDAISEVTDKLHKYFTSKLFENIKNLVKKIFKEEHFFILGKGLNQYIALEGALKVKEISYKHFEGFAAGELKHGVIALVEKGTPVFVILSNDDDYQDMLSAVAQVKARGANVIGISPKNNTLFDNFIPVPNVEKAAPIVNIIPFQLISYFMAVKLKRDPDKPRNLAKSVTVK